VSGVLYAYVCGVDTTLLYISVLCVVRVCVCVCVCLLLCT